MAVSYATYCRLTAKFVLAAFVVMAIEPAPSFGEQANLISDPGFEAGSRGWAAQGGKIALVQDAKQAHSGNSAIRVLTAKEGKQWSGRLYGSKRVEVVPGGRYLLSAWVKGQGQAGLGVYEYAYQDHAVKFRQRVSIATPQTLSTDWRQISFVYRPSDDNIASSACYVQVTGEGGQMLVDDVAFAVSPEPAVELSNGRIPAMAPAGTALRLPVAFRGPAANPQIEVTLRDDEGVVLSRQTANPSAAATETLAIALPAQMDQCATLSVVERTSGAVVLGRVDVCPKTMCDACAAAAARVKLQTPCHLVFVGDSLTALFQGHNYVDKIRWWLQSRLGDSVQVTNAGVGGDTITRVRDRLERDVLSLKPTPTHVFVFLGHNDSKLKSSSEYKEPVVLPADFERDYRDVVRAIQTKLKARVTIISASSSVYEITKATAEKAAKQGRAHNLFGKPEALEQFNAIARKVAADLGAGYLDVYEPFRVHPDKPNLFTPDGVHINDRGNRTVALEVLNYLAR